MTPRSSIESHPPGDPWPEDTDEAAQTARASRWRDAILAVSIAHFAFIQSWHALLFQQNFGYYNSISINRPSLAALLINIAAVGLGLWLLGRAVRRLNRRSLWMLANLAVCAAVLVPLNFARTHVWNFTAAKFATLSNESLLIAIGLAVVLGVLWFHRYAAKFITIVYILLSPMILFTVGKAAWHIVRPPVAPKELRASPTPAKVGAPHVVWILLDELDQRIAFETRPADVPLPELGRLYNECLHATNAFPPGGSTLYSLPALTIGREVRGARPASASDLVFNGSARWSEAETIFARARGLGLSTALVGWYHPYSRVLGHSLDRCEWFAYPPFEQERGRTVGEAAINQLCSVLSQFQQRRLHVRNVQDSEAAALDFLTNSPANLTLLHLPVPHHPGIYDPKRDRFTAWKYGRRREYLDNLVLADRLFGKLRAALEQAGTWDKTWLIVSSDHWWREAASYDGGRDHRVPFIVKASGRNEPIVYGKRLNTVATYYLVLSVLKDELSEAGQLTQWLDAFRMDPPTGYRPGGEPF
jgi:hypothetical protein